MAYSTTSVHPSGNRLACSLGNQARYPVVVSENVPAPLEWIVGSEDSFQFLTVSSSGETKRYSFDGQVSNTTFPNLVASRPLVGFGDPLRPVVPPESTSRYGRAIPAPDGGLLYIDQFQNLKHIFTGPDGVEVDTVVDPSIVDPLIDGRIVFSAKNQMWALYTSATSDRDSLGIHGDIMEGFHLHILKYVDGFQVSEEVVLEGDELVYEGMGPMWADVDEDGVDDIVTTVSTLDVDASIRVYFMNSDGTVREQLSSDPARARYLQLFGFGPVSIFGTGEPENEFVGLLDPGNNGIIEYYRYEPKNDGNGTIKFSADGLPTRYTAHSFFSRNVDQGVVGDFDGDGRAETVIQNEEGTRLVAIERATERNAETVWSIPLSASVKSNIAVSCVDGTPQILFGTTDSKLIRVHFELETLSPLSSPTEAPKVGPLAAPTPDEASSAATAATIFPMWIYAAFVLFLLSKRN